MRGSGRAVSIAWIGPFQGSATSMTTRRCDRSRRKFLLAAGATGAATLAMPQVSCAQTIAWKYQSTWPSKDIFHEFSVDYAKKVNEMSGGRLKLEVLAARPAVPAFQIQGAANSGILD